MDEGGVLKAIETVYDGNRFRSRLEARFAVFFNALSIPYQYEAEGFNLNGLYYLPDFWLPSLKIFIETKGPFTDNKGEEKAVALSRASKRMVYMFFDVPKFDFFGQYDRSAECVAYYPDGVDYDYMWCRKSCCGKFGIQFQGRSERIPCGCGILDPNRDHEFTADHPSILLAYTAARHHRFDGGSHAK